MKGTELEKYDPLGPVTWTPILQKLPRHIEGLKTEFVVQKCNRSLYDNVVEYAGGCFAEAGTADGATEKDLDDAFNPQKTAGYYVTLRTDYKPLPLKTVIKVAHKHGVPVIVDAASELPPKKNLRKYIAMGVDLVIFSGGKDISGPNNSGILAGRKDLIKLAHLQAYPFKGVGRVAKMSRETIIGFVVALKIYLKLDEEARFKAWEKKVTWIAEQLNTIKNVNAEIFYQTTIEENEPFVPTVAIEIDEKAHGINAKDLSDKLKDGNPSIQAPYEAYYLGPNSSGTMEFYKGKLAIDPQCLLEGEELIIVQRIKEILTARKIQPIKQ
jgi:L-seryl-tRNA(Ser) seleniumtransferase